MVWPSSAFQDWVTQVPVAALGHGDPLYCLPCQLGFCMGLLLPPAPKAASSASPIAALWCSMIFPPSPGSCVSPGLLWRAFWLPTTPPCEMSPSPVTATSRHSHGSAEHPTRASCLGGALPVHECKIKLAESNRLHTYLIQTYLNELSYTFILRS